MKWLADAHVFKRRGKVRWEIAFNWRCVWIIKRKGARKKTVRVQGFGYRTELHAWYGLWRYVVCGHRIDYPRQEIELATSEKSVFRKELMTGWIRQQIDTRREPVLEKGDDGYDDEETWSRETVPVDVDPEPERDEVVLKILGRDDDDLD